MAAIARRVVRVDANAGRPGTRNGPIGRPYCDIWLVRLQQ